ncbi:MAG: UDP-N-acetylglucosamine 1-carboxyvinyltransferase [Syntrophothermus sp.]
MEKYIIRGGRRLEGSVRVSGAKNAVLPVMAAALMAPGVSVLHRVPRIIDVETMMQLLSALGAKVSWAGPDTLEITPGCDLGWEAPDALIREMRASIQVLGPLLARLGRVKVFQPGGCAIGPRPIDFHIRGMEALGARQVGEGGCIVMEADRLRGAEIMLDLPSVGATENIMCAATLAQGTTVIRNAAREPEIVELQTFLNQMGAQVRGAGTDVIRVHGVNELHGAEYTVIPDRIEAGTFMVAAAITGGEVLVDDLIVDHQEAVIAKLLEAGIEVQRYEKAIRVAGRRPWRAFALRSQPYPGFPTDMQPQMMALAALAQGVSIITETVYSNRFKHADELMRMGAQIRLEGRCAIVTGVKALHGAVVNATDLRAGAGMVLAGLAAEGITRIEEIQRIERGYEDLAGKLAGLGAEISRDSTLSGLPML